MAEALSIFMVIRCTNKLIEMKFFLPLLSLIIATQSYAAHILGGEIYYDCLGNNNYEITIKVYRDCNSGAAPYDSPLILGVFRNSGDTPLIIKEEVSFPGSIQIPLGFNNPCIQIPNLCIQEAIYKKTINLPADANGYTLTYQRCCRGHIDNLSNPEDEGLTLSIQIPGTASGVTCNSSPRFDNRPPLVVCKGEELVFDFSATDPNGDEITYQLCTPHHGGTSNDPRPNPPTKPPYYNVVWKDGFDQNMPFGEESPISLGLNTGLLTVTPNLEGLFVIGVCAVESRNGEMLSINRSDYLINVVDCTPSVVSDIVSQTPDQFCGDETINFESNSSGASSFFWDFGVENDPNATSTNENPSYTFEEEGTYNVTLIASINGECSDTTEEVFIIYQGVNAYFEPPDGQCISNNEFEFETLGNFPDDNVEFEWYFGPFANISSANTQNVSGITFNELGYIPVTLSASYEICESSFTDSIFIYMEPEVNFGVIKDLYCAPSKIQFIDSSEAFAEIIYSWNFGDGNFSEEANPQHTYQEPGNYDVSLNISTDVGCITGVVMERENFITVYPSPIAAFNIEPEEATVFNPEIQFFDESTDSEQHFYFFNDSTSTEERFTTRNFIEGGYHYPYQIVYNQFGCPDSTTRKLYIEPLTTFYAPNAFSPGDDNDINPIFKPILFDIDNYELTIMNRWGERIFHTTNKHEGWDGRLNGKLLPAGVYVWKIRFRNHNGIPELHNGFITLIR